jgi:hypothetical protein
VEEAISKQVTKGQAVSGGDRYKQLDVSCPDLGGKALSSCGSDRRRWFL